MPGSRRARARAEPLRYLDERAFRTALPTGEAIVAMEAAFRAESAGEITTNDRQVLRNPLGEERESMMLTMPAAWRGAAFATKVVGYVADNPRHGRPAVQGVAVLIDADTGTPRLLTGAAVLTAARTAAMVGLATDRLAREDSRVLGLIGTGALALDMIRAIAEVRPIERVVAYNRSRDKAEALAARAPVATEVVDSAERAAERADVLVVATSAREAVVADAAIRPGTHVNAVGCFSPTGRELEGPTVGRSAVWVDGVEGALAEAGDLLLASREGHLGPLPEALAGDLAALAAGPRLAATKELTLFKSVGTAVADIGALLAAAARADDLDLGVRLG